jgi:nicotinamidase-related amidase
MRGSRELDARDAAFSILEGRKAALLVIDVQVDFVAHHGVCARGGADVSAMPAAIDRIAQVADAARSAGIDICFVRLETSAETESPAMLSLMQRQGRAGGANLCRPGTPGVDYWGVMPAPGDHEIVKRRYDAFLETSLDAWLRQRCIETVVVTGVSTDCCVDSTARAAFMRDYHVVVISDACAAGSRDIHEAALAALARHAASLTCTADFVEFMEATARSVKSV